MPLGINGAGELSPELIGDLEPGLGPGFLIQILQITRPAPGFRDSNSGVLGGVGNGGFSYSSSVSGIGGLNSNSYSQYLNTGHSDYRASGLQLRCLSE